MNTKVSAKRNCACSGGKWIRPNKRHAIYVRDGFKCVYCGRSVEETAITIDHVVPQALGGTNDASNLVTACRSCNSAKGKHTLRGFLSYLRTKNVDTNGISSRIRRLTAKRLKVMPR